MTTAQHTRGPWHVDGLMISNGAVTVCVLIEFDSFGGNHEAPNAKGNGSLLAAAPELLEALDDLLAFHDHTHPRHDALLEDYQESCIANEVPAKAADLLDNLQQAARAAITKATPTT